MIDYSAIGVMGGTCLPPGGVHEAAPGFPRLGPQQVPQNLPDAKHHPVILVSGLQSWFHSLSAEHSRIFLRYLFEFDPDQQSPAPGLFLQALSTLRLIACYDMSPVMSRDKFVELVHWRGVEDEPRVPGLEPVVDATTDGWCYEVTVVPSARPAMRLALGFNPWAPAVAARLLAEPGVWAPGRVALSWGHAGATDHGPAYTQGHLTASAEGLKVRDLIPLLTGWARIGATGDRLAMSSDGLTVHTTSVPTLFEDKPRARSMLLTYGLYAKVKVGTGISWSPFKTPSFVLMLATYESVRLVSANFTLTVPSGSGNTGYAATTTAGTTVSGDGWYGAPYLKMVPGSDDGAVVTTYALPAAHPFNPELRASLPGNGPPEFKFSLAGDAGTTMLVTGNFTVEVAGQVVIGSFDVGPAAKVGRAVRTAQQSLSYSVAGGECSPPGVDEEPTRNDDSEDDSDEEPETSPAVVPSRSSPPRNRPTV